MKCNKCNCSHTKSICPECGAKSWAATKTLVINTDAPRDHMVYVLKQVKVSLNKGYTWGTDSVKKSPCDTAYNYEFELQVA